MSDHVVSREVLYARFAAFAKGRAVGDSRAAHEALLDRLSANQRAAEAFGWTSCALERAGGMGRLSVWGMPPGDAQRHLIPDWRPASQQGAARQSGDPIRPQLDDLRSGRETKCGW